MQALIVDRDGLIAFATDAAHRYHLNTDHFLKTIRCESGWDPNILGDDNQSRGIVQIYRPAHPEITDAQASDPKWSIEWMAKIWSEGGAALWTCWRDMYGT